MPRSSPRACRIVSTLGPASASAERIERLIDAGMDVARINFSHGSHESHGEVTRIIREVCDRTGRHVAILQDLQGHKVRVGRSEAPVPLALGQRLRIGPGTTIDAGRLGIDYPRLAEFVEPGHHVFIDDGLIELCVESVEGDDLVCEVRIPGTLKSRKGVIFPDSDLEFPLINDKDLADARYGAELGVDFIAMSFVRSARELREMRVRLADWRAPSTRLVAKIEDRLGIENIDDILRAADGVLIARGDMGVTLPRERVPGIQKDLVRRANAVGVPVITATQMLESMTQNARPTRAEVSDVHNAVVDGTDAVMLSGETATGRYPVRSVEEMDRICRAAEAEPLRVVPLEVSRDEVSDHGRIADATAALAGKMGARCVVSFSLSGSTLRALSAARCPVPVHGVVADLGVYRSLLLQRGLSLRVRPRRSSFEELLGPTIEELRDEGAVCQGDSVIVVVGREEPAGRRRHVITVCEVE